MMMPLIRKAKSSDSERLQVLYRQLIAERETTSENIASALETIDKDHEALNTILVVEAGGIVVGCCQMVIYANPLRFPRWKAIIDSVVVDEAYRNKGYGRAMLKDAMKRLVERNVEITGLVCGYSRTIGQHLYPSIGFTDYGRGFLFYNDDIKQAT